MTRTRRAFLAGAGASLIAGTALAQRQPTRLLRLAVASAFAAVDAITEAGHPYYAALFGELRRLGWEEGRNLQVERSTFVDRDQADYGAIGRQIVAASPDVIFVNGVPQVAAVRAATATIPIVFVSPDPIGLGLAQSLARPGGNATGFATSTGPEFYQKMLQLLREVAPQATRIAYFTVPSNRDVRAPWLDPAAQKLGVTLIPIHLTGRLDEAALENAFAEVAREKAQAILVLPTGIFTANVETVARHLAKAGLPAITYLRELTVAGALMSYWADQVDLFRQAAGYIDRILRGTKPADLPVQQPMRFEFVVNLKTARALGIELPLPLMGFVSEWIE